MRDGVSLRDGGIVERFLWKKFLFEWGRTLGTFAGTFSGTTGPMVVFEGLEDFFFLKVFFESLLVLIKGTIVFVVAF